jgi:hypothetical protein
MRGEPFFDAAQMPFAPHASGVALRRQQLRDGDLPERQSVRDTANRDFIRAGANGEAACHKRGTGGCALGFDVEVEQPHTFAGEFVDARRRCATKDTSAVAFTETGAHSGA